MAVGPEQGLRKVVWQKIKDTIIEDSKKAGVWKVLILDQFTTRLLSSCCKLSDLMSERITIVEDLFKSREPIPEMKAIYFMTPTAKCVDAFIADFKNKPKYKAAYVYFTDYCPDSLFSKMKTSSCSKYIRVCKEINISFLPQEAQVFTFDNPGAFRSVYSPDSKDRIKTLESLADQIVTLCATLDEFPGVRYKKDSPVQHAKDLAELVDQKLAKYYEMDDTTKKKEKTPAQLLILDRAFDPMSPILHELTYQAMAYDLLPIKNDTYRYKAKDGSAKEALLNDSDELWVRLRHMHIAEVTEKMPKLVKEISASKKEPDSKVTIGTLAQIMKKMPSFRKQVAQKSVHVSLAEDCMTRYQKNVDRLYIFSLNGTTEENLNKLIQHVKIEGESEYILNWKDLGVPIISSPSLFSFKKTTRRERSQTYDLSRWTPIIKDVMEDAVDNKLDWPHVSGAPTAWNGSRAVSARQKHKASAQDDYRSGSRLIIFILGGVCYSEVRSAYEVTQAIKSCEVIIGSSHILTPISLLEDIRSLSAPPMQHLTIIDESTAS
ncbi:syntaxin-binding protein 3 isoform X2 [Denticeps clupeoides]|uniref:syntaxin-binding protein 3 isoform X2 n=1 Tax=Denticeps clupeoides TaxID=299321 RepID=UPI0010A3F7CF|nr:syntaxin-binding protein 3 isoform X2 [Denticeps clupeoides]